MASNNDCNDLIRPGLVAPKLEVPAIKKNLRSKVLPANVRALRRARLPIYQALFAELNEDGYQETFAYLQKLVTLESRLIEGATEGLKLKQLCDDPELLFELLDCAKKSEYMINGKLVDVVQDLLRIGNAFATGISDFQWVAEEVLLKTLTEARRLLIDDNHMTALTLYSLGQLYFKHRYYAQANEYYEECVAISENTSWIVSKTINKLLYTVACVEYGDSLNELANVLIASDPKRSRQLCEKSLSLAQNSNHLGATAKAHNNYGHVLMKMAKYEEARDQFLESAKKRRSENNLQMLCRSELDIAACILALQNYHESLRHSKRSFKLAEANGFPQELADSYEMIAKNERMLGINNSGADSFQKAVELYCDLNQPEKMRSARCWAAISIAQGIISPFTDTVLKSDAQQFGDNVYMSKLLDWELARKPFWEENQDGVKVATSALETFDNDGEVK